MEITAATELLSAAKAHVAAREALKGANVNSLHSDDPRFQAVTDTLDQMIAAIAKAEAA